MIYNIDTPQHIDKFVETTWKAIKRQALYIFCNTTFMSLPAHRPVGNKPRWADPGSGVGLWPIRAGVRRKMEQEEGGGEDGTRRVHVGRRI